jgi:cell division protease FtsH
VLVALFALWPSVAAPKSVSLSKVITQAHAGQIKSIYLNDPNSSLTATLKTGRVETAGYPLGYGSKLVEQFAPKITFTSTTTPPPNPYGPLFRSLILIGVLIAAMYFLIRRTMPSGKGKIANPLDGGKIPTTRFTDVAGLDEVVEEMTEVVQFLHNPKMFAGAGARMPHGFLLVGPPGTVTTLLARAIAGEAGVPFFALSGSDFLEAYVGIGAVRVRRVFEKARKCGSAIVFIDELDAVGRTRSSGQQNAGTDESDRTLNALLVAMDGFTQSQVIVLGATNRPEVLDSALLRAGRFDRKITFPSPDRVGREKILHLAAAPLHLAPDVDLASIARRTASLTGADLYFLANEAALTAARAGSSETSQSDFEKATEVTFLDRARTSMFVSDEERRVFAWHEAGHAVAACTIEAANKPVRVSIIPHGVAGGVTWMETEDLHLVSKSKALALLTVALAGRAGEMVLVGDDFTSGASGDLKAAGALAKNMVTEWGMSPSGLLFSDEHQFDRDDAAVAAINSLLADALTQAREVIANHATFHKALAEELIDADTVSGERVLELAKIYPPRTAA